MATITSTTSGAWATGATWVGGVKPADNDTVVIAAGHQIEYNEDMSNAGTWPNGIAGLTITGHATTPAMLYSKYSADGTYHLKIKTGTTIAGTNLAARGRILANSDGVWGNTGSLPFGRKFIIELITTASLVAQYLDIALYCTQPANLYATTYGTKYTVNSVNTGTDVLTLSGTHGWAANRPVMVRSTGTLPSPLAADTVYYASSPSGTTLKLAYVSGGTAIDITDSGSGTIEMYDGHQSTSTATVNVFEDLTGDPCWVTTDGHDAVLMADASAPEDYDQQRLSLVTINSGSLVLSANVDSIQYPGGRIYLMSRNVSIRSTCLSSVYVVNYNSYTHGGVFQCEVRSTAGQGVGVNNFYGYGIMYGLGNIVSGTVSGFSYGVIYGNNHTVSGVVAACANGLYQGYGWTDSGTILGCSNGVYSSYNHTISGRVMGCGNGINGSFSTIISGTVSGCSSGIVGGTGVILSSTGVIAGCTYGINATGGSNIYGTISGCAYGVIYGSTILRGATFKKNYRDLYLCILFGSATLESTSVVKNGAYLHATISMNECSYAAMISPQGGIAGSHYCYTAGGVSISATYSAGTHGTPPVSAPNGLIHEMTFQDSDRVAYVEFPIWAVAGVSLTAVLYGKLTGTAAWTTRPQIMICDPYAVWQTGDVPSTSGPMSSNTNWQTLSATYMPTADRELRVRIQGIGGNAGGTGTEKLYWFHQMGPLPTAIKYTTIAIEGAD